MKIAINKKFGGFGLSPAAYEALGVPWDGYGYAYNDWGKRTDPTLIDVLERLGKAAWGECSKIRIIEIPEGNNFEIESYDGIESVTAGYPRQTYEW